MAPSFHKAIRDRQSKTTQPYYHRNQQYSIIGLTNATGTLVERYTYTAYGTLGIYAADGTVRTTSSYNNRYTYTGREWDAELKLYHFRARWYDPATGGFISRDPLGYVDGMSLYRGYFGVTSVDPHGTNCTWKNSGKPILRSQKRSYAYCADPSVSVGSSTNPGPPIKVSNWVGCKCTQTATYHQVCRVGFLNLCFFSNESRFPTITDEVNFVVLLPQQGFVTCLGLVTAGVPIIGNGTILSATYYVLGNDPGNAAKQACDAECKKAVFIFPTMK